VLDNPYNYCINVYLTAADVVNYGNISGAYRINPLSLSSGEYLGLDPNKTIVSYCYTGQTTSMITAYLTILGYDAKIIKFGLNGMIYSNLYSHKYTLPTTDYPVVP